MQAALDTLGRGHVARLGRQLELGGLAGGSLGRPVGLVADRLQPDQRRAGLDLAADRRPGTPSPGPRNGARSTVSIFMLSSTRTGAPASTSSPTASGVATTRAGAGERSTPPSSRLTRWVTPSTSTRWIGPCVAVTSRKRCPLTTIRPLCSSNRSTSTSTVRSPPPETPTRNRFGPMRATVTR